MSGVQIPHQFEAGKDGIERCWACRATRIRSGMVIPMAAPCPTRSRLSGVFVEDQYVAPLDALLADIQTTANTTAQPMIRIPASSSS